MLSVNNIDEGVIIVCKENNFYEPLIIQNDEGEEEVSPVYITDEE